MRRKILFICGRAKKRSLTAEDVYASSVDIEARSAGISPDSDNPVTPESIQWADQILVMENVHKKKLNREFGEHLSSKRVGVLGIPDKYEYMDPQLVIRIRKTTAQFI